MSTNKNYTKTLIFIIFSITLFLFFPFLSFASNDLEKNLKAKIGEINKNLLPSLIPLEKGLAVSLSKDVALAPSSIIDDSIKILAVDSRLGISLFKPDKFTKGIEFKSPDKNSEFFFLVTHRDTFNILLTEGKIEENSIKISGKHVLGSVLVSINLDPIGIVLKNDDSSSEVLIIKSFEQEIMKLTKRKSGWLGIQGQTVTEDMKKILSTNHGVIVTNVYPDGPASKGGIKRGDVILEADKTSIKDIKDLQNLLSTKFSGENIQIKFLRNNSTMEVNLILEDPPEMITNVKTQPFALSGLEITEIPNTIKQSLKGNIKGIFVNNISENSPVLGILKKGDIIVELNKREITNTQEFYEIVSKSTGDLLILVYRQDNFQYVIIPAQKFR